LFTALQEDYACDETSLNALEKAGLASILAGDYRPEGSEIPYCRNEYMRIYYTPNPDPDYSDLEPTQNGGFDQVARISDTAQYEVLFTTMQWEPNTDPPNPGSVLAEATAFLYTAVKENPERYPRGMTVRILLGNYPVMSDFEYGSQIWEAIADLRAAGVDKMVDPAIGWRLEIANYAGTYPHAHTKFVVVDGKRTAAMGFNYGYLHFPKDHVSGRGYDLFDLGLLVSGPVAQDSIAAYDDMWNGANQVHCEDLSLENEDWLDSCTELKATVDHVPEVLRTYLPPTGNTNAFSLYRTTVRAEADAFLYDSLASTQESIDAIEVNFSLEMVCMLNLVIPDFCTYEDALPWMNAMLEAIETNGVKIRVIMENTNSNGLENRVGGSVFLEELERRGLQDQVELRFYNGKLHAKSMLMDEALLVIGSQNLHYSSWGEGGLAEYNVTTNDPQAIEEYKAMFEAKWAEATSFWETEYGTSP
jgi:phosphatidylserine/phosphatidylglycerophosphate/cardiolipin synthase-like enzyme